MTAGASPWDPGPTAVPRVGPRGGPVVSVWLVHTNDDADYYETIFDFAVFVEAARAGTPRLRVWTGRRDVDRLGLRQTLRRIVAAEAEAARAALDDMAAAADATEAREGMGLVLTLAAQGTLLAMRATPAGLAVGALLGAAGLLTMRGRKGPGPDDAALLEVEIARAQEAADAALPGLSLRLHPDLAAAGGDPEAWPLPQAVRDVMERPCSPES